MLGLSGFTHALGLSDTLGAVCHTGLQPHGPPTPRASNPTGEAAGPQAGDPATHACVSPLSLRQFLAGVLLAETKFRFQIEADIAPFRGLLLGLFFITTGEQ